MTDTQRPFNEALAALNAKNLVAAEALFRKVLKADNKHIPALNLITVVLMSQGRFSEAEGFIERATRLNRASDVSFYNYGLISKHLNKPQQALDHFSKRSRSIQRSQRHGIIVERSSMIWSDTIWRCRISTGRSRWMSATLKPMRTGESP
jgi:tetratricopeptide (TPR) repeat protein